MPLQANRIDAELIRVAKRRPVNLPAVLAQPVLDARPEVLVCQRFLRHNALRTYAVQNRGVDLRRRNGHCTAHLVGYLLNDGGGLCIALYSGLAYALAHLVRQGQTVRPAYAMNIAGHNVHSDKGPVVQRLYQLHCVTRYVVRPAHHVCVAYI